MAGRFEGLSDLEWQLLADIFPPAPPQRGRGMPHIPFRKVVNTSLYVLTTGCCWCDIPRAPHGLPKVRHIGGGNVGRPMGPSLRCRPGPSGSPRNTG